MPRTPLSKWAQQASKDVSRKTSPWWDVSIVGPLARVPDALKKAKAIQEANEVDYAVSRALLADAAGLLDNPEVTVRTDQGVEVEEGLVLGEILRHFETQTVANITGWMEHSLGFRGLGLGIKVGSVGLGSGMFGVGGTSRVNLNSFGTTRANLVGDSFIAVFDKIRDGHAADTLRVVSPSEPESIELVETLVRAIGERFGHESHTDSTLSSLLPRITASIRTDISHVSDRLNALLRTPVERRPRVTIVGARVASHVLLGGAVQFEGEDRWLRLFPIGLLQRASQAMYLPEAEMQKILKLQA